MNDLTRQSLALTLVFALLCAVLWFLKTRGLAQVRFGTRARGTKRELELIDRLVLTPNHSVQLVRVAGKVLVLGVHTAGITVLRDLTAQEIAPQ